MFIGIGSLIVAKHPALHSLAEVTIVGMFTVVLMAWVVPPLIFGWLVKIGQQDTKDTDNYRAACPHWLLSSGMVDRIVLWLYHRMDNPAVAWR